MAIHFDYPFHFNGSGRTATTGEEEHIRGLIEQLLFTQPGERVNRPDFGSGLLQLVFAPASEELATTLQFTVQATLQQWLGERIEVDAVEVRVEDSTMRITVRYRLRPGGEARIAELSRQL